MIRSVLALAALAVAVPAFATPTGVIDDPYGARSISIGRFETVEQRLAASFAQGDRTPEVLLNLAAIRIRQQDKESAGALYRMVLEQPNIDMATLKGTAWSHDLARRGQTRAVAFTR